MNWDEILLDPLRDFFTSVIGFLPKIIAALVLLLAAWILAKVLRNLARRLVKASGIDRRMGRGDQTPIARGTGTAVFWIVWILFILAILQVLGLEGVISSIQLLFAKIFSAIPNILAAFIILAVFFFVGRLAARWVTGFLTRIRFNEVPVKLGLTDRVIEGAGSPSSIVGYIVLFVILLLAVIMAAEILNFTLLNQLIAGFTTFFAQVIWGLIIIGIGLFIANLVARILQSGGRSSATVTLVRVFIIVLAVAIALRAMGFANDIILLIFGLILGAMAVAAALAFGLGGRRAAGRLLDRWTGTEGTGGSGSTSGGTGVSPGTPESPGGQDRADE